MLRGAQLSLRRQLLSIELLLCLLLLRCLHLPLDESLCDCFMVVRARSRQAGELICLLLL